MFKVPLCQVLPNVVNKSMIQAFSVAVVQRLQSAPIHPTVLVAGFVKTEVKYILAIHGSNWVIRSNLL
jgi:hypothetical protein